MESIEKSIEINLPVNSVYNQWTQFEEFPHFMEGIVEVRQIDDQHLHWKAKIGGKEKEWNAEITEQTPDKRIAWKSTDGAPNGGVVTFHYLDPQNTKMMLQVDYSPETFVEEVGDILGFVTRRVEGDLKRFKEFIETRGKETGAWRGKIAHA